MRSPARSTYRLQITADDTLQDAVELVPHLDRLGVDWLYLSPLLRATSGSGHGYDVTDHALVDPERGGDAGLAAVAQAAHAVGLGVVVDIVPNHVGVSVPRESVWWWDVLTHGRESRWATAFDVDWDFGGGRLRIPVLGDDGLDALELDGGLLRYHDHVYPVAPGTAQAGDDAVAVHARQHYELVDWHREQAELNYRRFFAVSTLAAVRVEDPEVFRASHAEIGRWFEQGWVDGLRVDHPDGLADPGGYLDDLAALTGGAPVLVEKILEGDEQMPSAWRTTGTTGYDRLAVVDRVLVDPAGRDALDALDTELRGTAADWAEMAHDAKRQVADGILRSEVLRLARLVPEIDRADDAIAELLACFPVYRSYLPFGAEHLQHAVDAAIAHRPELAEPVLVVAARLAEVGTEVSVRFQQTSGMVMAKGVEDCSFYRWSRLTSLTEVGAEPAEFAVDAAEFHRRSRALHEAWPESMTTLSTHDTKRSEDVRARISVLSEVPERWAELLRTWLAAAPVPDGPLANLVGQAVIGAWPADRDRLHGYAEKAMREAQTATSWLAVDDAFEAAVHRFVDTALDAPETDPDGALQRQLAALLTVVIPAGRSNSLSAKLLQLAGVGVPDVYQGTEVWDDSLVDPDNRRPVDHARIADLLTRIDTGWLPSVDASGAAKLLVTSRALRARRELPGLFTGHEPVAATGAAAEHLVGFDRGGAIALATRLPVRLERDGGWRDTTVTLPTGRWTDVVSGSALPGSEGGPVPVSALLGRFPVALLVPTERAAAVLSPTDRRSS